MVTFLFVLEDQPGVLSGILNEFADSSYNILTINQSIPINGVASVTISAQAHDTTADAELLLENIRTLKGVSKAELIAGER